MSRGAMDDIDINNRDVVYFGETWTDSCWIDYSKLKCHLIAPVHAKPFPFDSSDLYGHANEMLNNINYIDNKINRRGLLTSQVYTGLGDATDIICDSSLNECIINCPTSGSCNNINIICPFNSEDPDSCTYCEINCGNAACGNTIINSTNCDNVVINAYYLYSVNNGSIIYAPGVPGLQLDEDVTASSGMKNLTINTGAAQWPWYNVYRTTIYSSEYIGNYIEFTCNYAWCNRNEFHIYGSSILSLIAENNGDFRELDVTLYHSLTQFQAYITSSGAWLGDSIIDGTNGGSIDILIENTAIFAFNTIYCPINSSIINSKACYIEHGYYTTSSDNEIYAYDGIPRDLVLNYDDIDETYTYNSESLFDDIYCTETSDFDSSCTISDETSYDSCDCIFPTPSPTDIVTVVPTKFPTLAPTNMPTVFSITSKTTSDSSGSGSNNNNDSNTDGDNNSPLLQLLFGVFAGIIVICICSYCVIKFIERRDEKKLKDKPNGSIMRSISPASSAQAVVSHVVSASPVAGMNVNMHMPAEGPAEGMGFGTGDDGNASIKSPYAMVGGTNETPGYIGDSNNNNNNNNSAPNNYNAINSVNMNNLNSMNNMYNISNIQNNMIGMNGMGGMIGVNINSYNMNGIQMNGNNLNANNNYNYGNNVNVTLAVESSNVSVVNVSSNDTNEQKEDTKDNKVNGVNSLLDDSDHESSSQELIENLRQQMTMAQSVKNLNANLAVKANDACDKVIKNDAIEDDDDVAVDLNGITPGPAFAE